MNQHFAENLFSFFLGTSGLVTYLSIFGVLLICGLGVPIPEDITLITAGFLAGQGHIHFWGAVGVGMVGVLAGDIFLFSVGRRYGRHVLTLPVFRSFITPSRIERAESRLQRNAKFICFIARFLPGLRSAVYLTAGSMRVPFVTFIVQDGLAALLSVPLWVWVGWYFSQEIEEALHYAREVQTVFLVAVGVLIVSYIGWRIFAARKRRKNVSHTEYKAAALTK